MFLIQILLVLINQPSSIVQTIVNKSTHLKCLCGEKRPLVIHGTSCKIEVEGCCRVKCERFFREGPLLQCVSSLYKQMVIDTIFICFCEDCEQNDGDKKPYYMSKGLMVSTIPSDPDRPSSG